MKLSFNSDKLLIILLELNLCAADLLLHNLFFSGVWGVLTILSIVTYPYNKSND